MFAINRKDAGTPAAKGEPVTLHIDGAEVTVPAGTSIMRAAAAAGGAIPKLCATDTLKAFGSCRVCLVEVEGQRGLPRLVHDAGRAGHEGEDAERQAAPVAQGRRGTLRLRSPAELQGLPGRHALRAAERRRRPRRHDQPLRLRRRESLQMRPCDTSNPYFQFDPTLCIACSRCVRACDEVQGTFALTIEGRGFASRVAASQDETFRESECVSCGACVESCPTAALSEKPLAIIGRPEQAVTTTCAYCGVGCSLEAEVKDEQVVRMVPSRDGKANRGHACVKGRFAYGYATHADRITNR